MKEFPKKKYRARSIITEPILVWLSLMTSQKWVGILKPLLFNSNYWLLKRHFNSRLVVGLGELLITQWDVHPVLSYTSRPIAPLINGRSDHKLAQPWMSGLSLSICPSRWTLRLPESHKLSWYLHQGGQSSQKHCPRFPRRMDQEALSYPRTLLDQKVTCNKKQTSELLGC